MNDKTQVIVLSQMDYKENDALIKVFSYDYGLMTFLAQNMVYPVTAQENGVQGRVTVSFVVETDGSITDVEVARSVDPFLDREAMRIVKAMPKWTPGKKDGKPVRVKYTVPVVFRLQ